LIAVEIEPQVEGVPDMLFEILIGLLIGAFVGAVIVLAVITASAVIDCARDWWGSGTDVIVVDPSTSSELERIAAENGSKRHKRFVYNKSTGENKLVESDSISGELAYRSRVELYVA